MVGRHEWNAVVIEPLAAHLAHGAWFAQQALNRGESQGDDDLRLDEVDLFAQPWQAGRHLGGLRLAVAGFTRGHVGTAFQDIGDEDILAGVFHRTDDPCQELARLAHERLATQILLLAGGFSHEEKFREGVADPVDDLRPAFHQMRAAGAGQDLRFQLRQLGQAAIVAGRGFPGGRCWRWCCCRYRFNNRSGGGNRILFEKGIGKRKELLQSGATRNGGGSE